MGSCFNWLFNSIFIRFLFYDSIRKCKSKTYIFFIIIDNSSGENFIFWMCTFKIFNFVSVSKFILKREYLIMLCNIQGKYFYIFYVHNVYVIINVCSTSRMFIQFSGAFLLIITYKFYIINCEKKLFLPYIYLVKKFQFFLKL